MWKLIRAVPFTTLLSPSASQKYHCNHSKALLSLIVIPSTFSHKRSCSSSTPCLNAKKSVLADYLTGFLKLSRNRALAVSSSYLHIKSLEKPQEVVHFFRGLGFSDAQIQSIARRGPWILFANVEKTLRHKIVFFQELGLSGPCLTSFISRSPYVLGSSLDRSLKPSIHLIENAFRRDGRHRSKELIGEVLIRILNKCAAVASRKRRLEASILYLESCGVVGSQLSSLLMRNPRIFTLRKDKLAEIVARALDMIISPDSGMMVHAIYSLSCVSIKTLNGKLQMLREFEFSKNEIDSMFGKFPYMFALSETCLWSKLELFLHNLKMNKAMLVQHPIFLSFSMKERVIPRYKVVEILKSRGLLRKDSSLIAALCVSHLRFSEKYILPFRDDVEELQLAYKRKFLVTSVK